MGVIQLHRGSDGHYYLRLVAANGEILASSEGYRTHWGAKRAARKNFAGLKLVDLTAKRFGAPA